MAPVIKCWERFRGTLLGQVLLAAVYGAMVILIMICFTGNGQFIYELS